MPSKKKLKGKIDYLRSYVQGMDEVTDLLNARIQSTEQALRTRTDERDQWRAKYELLLHTPEYKADTEAASKRGEQLAVQKFRAWFLKTAQELDKVVQDSDEE